MYGTNPPVGLLSSRRLSGADSGLERNLKKREWHTAIDKIDLWQQLGAGLVLLAAPWEVHGRVARATTPTSTVLQPQQLPEAERLAELASAHWFF